MLGVASLTVVADAGYSSGTIDLAERAALPAQREVGCGLVALDLYDDLFKQCPQQLLPVTRPG